MISSILMGFLNTVLFCAIIILIAFVILWVLKWMGVTPDADVLKWGKIVVALLCLIAVVGWLLSLVGYGTFAPHLLR